MKTKRHTNSLHSTKGNLARRLRGLRLMHVMAGSEILGISISPSSTAPTPQNARAALRVDLRMERRG